MRKEYLEVGEFVALHGLKGELRLYPWCDPGDLDGAEIFYFGKEKTPRKVQRVRPHKNIYVVKLQGVDTPEEAAEFRGRVAFMHRDDIPLPEGLYFIQDLVGLEVLDADTGARYGELTDVAATGANDVYCVRGEDGKETWIPAIPQVIAAVEIEKGRMQIRPLKGLFDE